MGATPVIGARIAEAISRIPPSNSPLPAQHPRRRYHRHRMLLEPLLLRIVVWPRWFHASAHRPFAAAKLSTRPSREFTYPFYRSLNSVTKWVSSFSYPWPDLDPDDVTGPGHRRPPRCHREQGRGGRNTAHRKGQLVFALGGGVMCRVPDGLWMVPPHCGVWLPGGTRHTNIATANARILFVFIEPGGAAELPDRCCTLSISPLLRELIIALSDRHAAGPRRAPRRAIAAERIAAHAGPAAASCRSRPNRACNGSRQRWPRILRSQHDGRMGLGEWRSARAVSRVSSYGKPV